MAMIITAGSPISPIVDCQSATVSCARIAILRVTRLVSIGPHQPRLPTVASLSTAIRCVYDVYLIYDIYHRERLLTVRLRTRDRRTACGSCVVARWIARTRCMRPLRVAFASTLRGPARWLFCLECQSLSHLPFAMSLPRNMDRPHGHAVALCDVLPTIAPRVKLVHLSQHDRSDHCLDCRSPIPFDLWDLANHYLWPRCSTAMAAAACDGRPDVGPAAEWARLDGGSHGFTFSSSRIATIRRSESRLRLLQTTSRSLLTILRFRTASRTSCVTGSMDAAP